MQQAKQTSIAAVSGRAASLERRRAASTQGKTALRNTDRTRTGERTATLSAPAPSAPAAIAPSAPSPSAPAPVAVSPAPAASGTLPAGLSGRELSKAIRRLQTQGKTALREGLGAADAATSAPVSQPSVNAVANGASAAQSVARERRARMAQQGRGNSEPARPSARVRERSPIQAPPKAFESSTIAGQRVTGLRIGRGMNVTGNEYGSCLGVSGTEYMGNENFSGFCDTGPRPGARKVGAARTFGGQVVTGTQVRNRVAITGDESNSEIKITGEADQALADDLLNTDRQGGQTPTQFRRMHNPHGHSVWGTNIARNADIAGSRERERPSRGMEVTHGGNTVSGTAVGRSTRVTGDEPGSCRSLTGTQYLRAPAQQPLCETGPGAAPKVGLSSTFAGRRVSGTQVGQRIMRRGELTGLAGSCQPVSGTEYVGAEQYQALCGTSPQADEEGTKMAQTWQRQTVTGVDVEHNSRVTGSEHGACNTITGTPYIGRSQYEVGCDPSEVETTAARVARAQRGHRITGDVAFNTPKMTGIDRGNHRVLTGTPYQANDQDVEIGASASENAATAAIEGFSIRTPQREALRRRSQEQDVARPITGAFNVGDGKVTGNLEFMPTTRSVQPGMNGERTRVTGEGRMEGLPITGNVWNQGTREGAREVTGTERTSATARNLTEGGAHAKAFASASKFKGSQSQTTPKNLVTGTHGYNGKARVTVSGGATG